MPVGDPQLVWRRRMYQIDVSKVEKWSPDVRAGMMLTSSVQNIHILPVPHPDTEY